MCIGPKIRVTTSFSIERYKRQDSGTYLTYRINMSLYPVKTASKNEGKTNIFSGMSILFSH